MAGEARARHLRVLGSAGRKLSTTAGPLGGRRHVGGDYRRRRVSVIKGATATAIKRRGEEGETVVELTAVALERTASSGKGWSERGSEGDLRRPRLKTSSVQRLRGERAAAGAGTRFGGDKLLAPQLGENEAVVLFVEHAAAGDNLTGAPLYVVHVSAKQAVQQIAAARDRPIPTVIVIDTTAKDGPAHGLTDEAGHWWDVAVPAVGDTPRLREAYQTYLENAARARLVN